MRRGNQALIAGFVLAIACTITRAGSVTYLTSDVGGVFDGRSIAISPNFANDHTILIGGENGHVYISHDGLGFKQQTVTDNSDDTGRTYDSVIFTSSYASDHTLFAAGNGEDIQRSIDGGVNWAAVNATAQAASLGVSPDYSHDQTMFAANFSGVQRSTDSGASFTSLTLPGSDGANLVHAQPAVWN